MSTRTVLVAGLAALAAAAPALADPVADTPATVTVGLHGERLTVRGHLDAPPGYTRVVFRARGTATTRTLALLESANGRRVAAARLDPGETYVTRVVLRDRRHLVLDSGSDTTLSFRPRGEGDAADVGPVDASLTITDDAIRAPEVLPRRGLIRIANRAGRNRALTAIHVRTGARHDLLGPVSPGTVNRVETALPTGRYRLVSGETVTRVEVI